MTATIEAGDILWNVKASLDPVAQGLAKSRMALVAFGGAITGTLGVAVSKAASFGTAMAEVSTLGVQDLGTLKTAVMDVSAEYGLGLTDAAKGAYQAISAGVKEVEAPQMLATAAKAATAGISDLTTAIELGTSVTNAYGRQMSDVGTVYDQAFIAVKMGVTTFDELAGSIGKASPMLSAAKVGSDEMFASIAALTKGGLATTEAVTGVRQAVQAVIKPSSEAEQIAEALGLKFDAQALAAQGLQGFLQDVGRATGGNIEVLSKLFPQVEGLNSVLALTGTQAGTFADILDEMRDSTGATDEAFQTFVENNPAFAWEQLKSQLQVTAVLIGDALLPALRSIVEHIRPVIKGMTEWIQAHPGLTTAIAAVAGIVGTLALGLGTLGFVLTPLIGLMGVGGLTGVAGAAGVSMAGLAAGLGTLGIALVGIGIPLGLVLAGLWKVHQAHKELEESTRRLAGAESEYVQRLREKGVMIDYLALKEMDYEKRQRYYRQQEKEGMDTSLRQWFEYYAGRAESEEEFGLMRNLVLNKQIDAEKAAILVSKNLREDQYQFLISATESETRIYLEALGIRGERSAELDQELLARTGDTAATRQRIWLDKEEETADRSRSIWSRFFEWLALSPAYAGEWLQGLFTGGGGGRAGPPPFGHLQTGTDYWRGGPAIVHPGEIVIPNLPAGSQVIPAGEAGGQHNEVYVNVALSMLDPSQMDGPALKRIATALGEEIADGLGDRLRTTLHRRGRAV